MAERMKVVARTTEAEKTVWCFLRKMAVSRGLILGIIMISLL